MFSNVLIFTCIVYMNFPRLRIPCGKHRKKAFHRTLEFKVDGSNPGLGGHSVIKRQCFSFEHPDIVDILRNYTTIMAARPFKDGKNNPTQRELAWHHSPWLRISHELLACLENMDSWYKRGTNNKLQCIFTVGSHWDAFRRHLKLFGV